MTDELISKTDVVKIVKSVLSPASSLINVARARRQMLNEINELESKPEPHWIPCSERLPENGRQVLVYARSVHYALAKYDEMREADGTYKKQWVTFDAWKPFYSIKEVIAWCELPEFYKGATE